MEKYCLEDMDYVPRIELTDHFASTHKMQMPIISESTPIASAPIITSPESADMPKPMVKQPLITIAETVKQEKVQQRVLDPSPMSTKTQLKQVQASLTTKMPPIHPADLIEPVHAPSMT